MHPSNVVLVGYATVGADGDPRDPILSIDMPRHLVTEDTLTFMRSVISAHGFHDHRQPSVQ